MLKSFLGEAAVWRNKMLLGCSMSLSQTQSVQPGLRSADGAPQPVWSSWGPDPQIHWRLTSTASVVLAAFLSSGAVWDLLYWISLAGLEQPQGYFLQNQSMNRAFFAVKCHLYEFRKKKVIIPCDSSYPHVPKYPGNYWFSCSICSNYICLATSACFPKLFSQTKPMNLHIHIVFPCRTCPVLVPLVPMFPVRLGQLYRQQLALPLQCLVCKCISGCSSLETNQFGPGSFHGGDRRNYTLQFVQALSCLWAGWFSTPSKQLGPAFRSITRVPGVIRTLLDELQFL